ncbi:MAG: glycoside hydrolase family 31 protein [Spirochaetales bacterium]|nr:glycoside hydrolase family 31 protein [Spirochaetales bacterium]
MLTVITHNPQGKGNPYIQGAEERTPRNPSFRDKVSCGLITEPADSSLNITAQITINGKDSRKAQAKWICNEENTSRWQVVMPSVNPFDRVEYCFVLNEDSEEEIRTESFSYTAEGFVTAPSLSSVRKTADSLILETKAASLSFFRIVKISESGDISIRLVKDYNPGSNTEESLLSQDRCLTTAIRDYELTVDADSGTLGMAFEGNVFYQETRALEFRVDEKGHPRAVTVCHKADTEEQFFGFGERFNSLNQRGNVLDVRVYEEYKSQNEGNRTYLPIPFFLSSRGWGHCINSPLRVSYDLREQSSWSYSAELDSWDMECCVYTGRPEEILKSQARLSGFPVLPPEWAFGPWMSSNEWNSQKRVLKELNTSRELNIPVSVLVIEAWSDEKNFYIWNDAEYEVKDPSESFCYNDFSFPEEGLWPDPKGMVEDIHKDGTKLILWQIPVSKHLEDGVKCRQNEVDKQYMVDKGYCVKNQDGSPYTVKPWWFTHSLVIDFTNPEATDWWMDKRRYLIDELEIDGFKTDGGEHLWGRDLQFADGRTSMRLWNEYPNHYINSYYKYINERNGGITFSRSGFMGVQNSPVHWAGDQDSTWEAHRSILNAVLNAGLSGVPFMGWDIGGFSGEIPTAELYLRSTAFACFGSIMQYHSEFYDHRTPHVDRTPWNIAERTGAPEVIDIYRYYAELRMQLIPYIMKEAKYCGTSGSPLMRLMFLDFPEDQICWSLQDQYMFGRSLLVCPLLYEGETQRDVYLPEGRWYDFFTGEAIEGGQRIKVDTPLNHIPVFSRDKSLLDCIELPAEVKI